MRTVWILGLATGCVAQVDVSGPVVEGDADRTSVAVVVRNTGVVPLWVWERPSRVAPPDGTGVAVMAYEVDLSWPGGCFQYIVPPAVVVAPGDEEALVFETIGAVPYGEPDLACADREGIDCADELDVRVAWSTEPLDAPIRAHADPRAVVAAREDGVAVSTWSRGGP